MRRKNVLGKGLSALIPDMPEIGTFSRIVTCGVEQIQPNPHQPRKSFDEESLKELAASISTKGILQPLLVRKVSDDGYELIAGERRWLAAQKAGLHEVPVIVMNVDNVESIQLSLIENIQRDDLNPLDLAGAYRVLIDTFHISHEDLSQRLGKRRSTITNILRLSNLPESVRDKLRSGDISMGHARAILGCDDPQVQTSVCTSVIKKDLSVRQTEKLITALKSSKNKPSKVPSIDPGLALVQSELTEILKTRVRIISKGRHKKLQIDFFTNEDLIRIVDIIKTGIVH